uniref:Beta-1,4-galactosyltransferase n=1 Tax=Strigops habroptila TaxID=2489341 RepID=A0A672UV22_STRHB
MGERKNRFLWEENGTGGGKNRPLWGKSRGPGERTGPSGERAGCPGEERAPWEGNWPLWGENGPPRRENRTHRGRTTPPPGAEQDPAGGRTGSAGKELAEPARPAALGPLPRFRAVGMAPGLPPLNPPLPSTPPRSGAADGDLQPGANAGADPGQEPGGAGGRPVPTARLRAPVPHGRHHPAPQPGDPPGPPPLLPAPLPAAPAAPVRHLRGAPGETRAGGDTGGGVHWLHSAVTGPVSPPQAGNSTFNRAKLLNVGVKEALKDEEWDCLFLHDVDLIPENDHNLYTCDPWNPKHVSVAMNKFGYRWVMEAEGKPGATGSSGSAPCPPAACRTPSTSGGSQRSPLTST